MKVHELIDALSALDKNGDASAALKEIRRRAEVEHNARMQTPEGARAAFDRIRAHAAKHRDSRGNTNAASDLDLIAWNGVRSDVFGAISLANPPPPPPDGWGDDPELVHAHEKAHNKKLWERTDAIVAAAGVTEKGVVS